ncbi:3455_t:CDS:1 [Acaulospora morrowiae]|uniref:3455_t:CDS:1 n=1 Tax=Acaulospora morrowiae TaxID=94023 RepID=A0A9N8Z4L8_9GLOM|nr:3455_t:CDS:1 [Acaulospora morrowiae]
MSEVDNEKLNDIWRNGWQNIDYATNISVESILGNLRNLFLEKFHLLNEPEKKELMSRFDSFADKWHVEHQDKSPKLCERCQGWAYASQYCENCIRDFFKKNFGNWTSGNGEIDKVIQDAQLNATCPDVVTEWVPFNDLEKVEHKTESSRSIIYSAVWNKGPFNKYNPETNAVERLGATTIILKKVKNSDKMDEDWFKVCVK